MSSIDAVVFYHIDCCDGFGAAWVWHEFNHKNSHIYENIKYIPMKYGDDPFQEELLVNKEIFILDFSFSREILISICTLATQVTLIDHHKTAGEFLLNWEGAPENLRVYFDENYSGASLTWMIYTNDPTMPKLISYIEDRDLWRHKLLFTKEISAVIANTAKDFIAYSELEVLLENSDSYNSVVKIGSYLLTAWNRLCEEIAEDVKECVIKINGSPECEYYVGLVCNCSPQFRSEVGNILAIRSGTFGCTYHTRGDGTVKFSLRSNGDYDVTKIAKYFGGGGHKNAASFELKESDSAAFSVEMP